MHIHSKSFFTKAAIWLATEVILNVVGLDNLANYGEFVFEHSPLAKQYKPTFGAELIYKQKTAFPQFLLTGATS